MATKSTENKIDCVSKNSQYWINDELILVCSTVEVRTFSIPGLKFKHVERFAHQSCASMRAPQPRQSALLSLTLSSLSQLHRSYRI